MLLDTVQMSSTPLTIWRGKLWPMSSHCLEPPLNIQMLPQQMVLPKLNQLQPRTIRTPQYTAKSHGMSTAAALSRRTTFWHARSLATPGCIPGFSSTAHDMAQEAVAHVQPLLGAAARHIHALVPVVPRRVRAVVVQRDAGAVLPVGAAACRCATQKGEALQGLPSCQLPVMAKQPSPSMGKADRVVPNLCAMSAGDQITVGGWFWRSVSPCLCQCPPPLWGMPG